MTDEMKAKREKLFSGAKNGYDLVDQAALEAMEAYCETYKQYLDNGKTERECTDYTIQLAQAQGFVPYQRGMELKPGDKVYRSNRGKSVMLVKIGRQDLSHGAQIVASHIDSPRLDFKPHPLYEDSELAYGKTHYYGGIRKYQWVAIPLELRGVVVLRDGTVVKVVLGQGNEPKFVITDLLPHLGAEQGKKPLSEAIPGENLNILMGSRPLGEDGDSDRVKLRVLDLLHEKYGICEDDFTSAELEVVPAFNATDIGLDGSLIGDTEKNPNGLDLIVTDSRVDLLENKVTLTVPAGNPKGIESFNQLAELLKGGDVMLAIGNSDVPVGQYTLKIFNYYGIDETAVANKLTYGNNVKEVASQVSEGAVDCGIIYATDAFSAGLTVVDSATAEMCGQVIYPAAVLKGDKEDAAQDFLAYLQTDAAMTVFESVGFSAA